MSSVRVNAFVNKIATNLVVYISSQERIGLNGKTKVKEFITHLPSLFSLGLNSFNNVKSFFKTSK